MKRLGSNTPRRPGLTSGRRRSGRRVGDLGSVLWVAALLGVSSLVACSRDSEPERTGEDDASAAVVEEEEPDRGDASLPAAAGEEPAGRARGDSAAVAEGEPMTERQAIGESDSGVQGTVTMGPACPVVDPDRPCAARPYATELVIRDAVSGDIVTEVQSDSAGRFRVALPPGEYLVGPLGPTVVTEPTADPVRFTVERGSYAEVELRFDTGVR